MANYPSEKVLLSWSGGKDSALALHEIQIIGGYEIIALLTTVTERYDRISLHGVRRSLLKQQAAALDLHLEVVSVPKNGSDEEYEGRMRAALSKHQESGVSAVVVGDIFLEDVRRRRETNLARTGLAGLFPLWQKDTRELARRFIDLGFRAIVTCVDSHQLDRSFVGRIFDADFLARLPPAVDPCGENGEFHTFVYGGPGFRRPIPFEVGDVVLRENRFYYCDLTPIQTDNAVFLGAARRERASLFL